MKKFAILISKLVLGLLYRVELVNPEKVPANGAAILCASHNTLIDMFFIGYRLKRWIYWMAKEELFKNPLSAFIFKQLGAFPVKRGKGDIGSIRTAYKLLQEGNIIGIFPHGTRVNDKNRNTARIKPGAAMLAINTGVQVIPATVQGDYKLFGRIYVIFGDPFTLDADKDKKYTSEELSEFSVEIMNRINSLSEGRK